MKVFICWGGRSSEKVAMAFRTWLPRLDARIVPFQSTTDIRLGTAWLDKVRNRLEEAHFGILCLTPESLDKPWLSFEAGALAMGVRKAPIVPLLFGGVTPEVLKGPLESWQGIVYSKASMKKLVLELHAMIAEQGTITEKDMEAMYDDWWSKLNGEIAPILSDLKDGLPEKAETSQEDMMREVLALVRNMSQSLNDQEQVIEQITAKAIFGNSRGEYASRQRLPPVTHRSAIGTRLEGLRELLARDEGSHIAGLRANLQAERDAAKAAAIEEMRAGRDAAKAAAEQRAEDEADKKKEARDVD